MNLVTSMRLIFHGRDHPLQSTHHPTRITLSMPDYAHPHLFTTHEPRTATHSDSFLSLSMPMSTPPTFIHPPMSMTPLELTHHAMPFTIYAHGDAHPTHIYSPVHVLDTTPIHSPCHAIHYLCPWQCPLPTPPTPIHQSMSLTRLQPTHHPPRLTCPHTPLAITHPNLLEASPLTRHPSPTDSCTSRII